MKRFSQFKLKKELILLFAVGVILLLDYAFPASYSVLHVQAQLQQPQQPSPIIGIKITSPIADQQVPADELTISGISTDNATTDCTVYADWNNLKPFQTATATGPGGVNDYSTWQFTYTPQYHIITNGTNNLTSKLACVDDSNGGTANLTKNYSINVIGIATTRAAEAAAISTQEEVQKQQQSSAIDNNNSLIKGISNTDNNATTLDNETKVVEEEILTGNNNISKPSIPIPIVAESYLNPNTVNVNITSPLAGQQVPAGNLTVTGISSDNSTTDCQIWLGWNEQKPFQTATATGPGGVNDYSRWNFTYTPQYHIITNGTNNLAAQISCFNSNTLANITKSYSVNVTGIIESSGQSALAAQNVSSSLPSVKIDNDDDDNRTATTPPPPQIIPSVPTTSPLPLQPAIKEDEEKEQMEEEPEPESEPQPTTSLTEDDKTEEDTDEEENPSEQGKEVEEIQEEEEVQEQLQQILEKVGKVEEEVQQEVGKIEEDILEEVENGLR